MLTPNYAVAIYMCLRSSSVKEKAYAGAKPHGHCQPQGQIQEAKGEIFCSHFLHAGQCRVQMWSDVIVATRDCMTGV